VTDPRRAGLDRYLALWDGLSAERIDDFLALATDDVVFSDPFQTARGKAHYRRVLAHTLAQGSPPRITVHRRMMEDDTAFVSWTYVQHMRGRDWTVEGVSVLRFDAEGRLASHVDHWDAAGQVYEHIPGIGGLLRFIRRRVAAR